MTCSRLGRPSETVNGSAFANAARECFSNFAPLNAAASAPSTRQGDAFASPNSAAPFHPASSNATVSHFSFLSLDRVHELSVPKLVQLPPTFSRIERKRPAG